MLAVGDFVKLYLILRRRFKGSNKLDTSEVLGHVNSKRVYLIICSFEVCTSNVICSFKN